MKKLIIKTFMFMIAVLMYGCPNGEGPYETYTKINTDGSCYREFIRSADSSFVAGDTAKNPFPMKLDSTWKVTFYKRMTNDTSRYNKLPASTTYKHDNSEYSYFATARKDYPSVKSLAESFRFNDSDWDSIVPLINYNKKFRWFYTYSEYSETYPAVNPFKIVSITDYLSKEEIETLYGENQNLYKGKNGFEIKSMLNNLEEKANSWFNRSCFEETYSLYLKYFQQFKNLPIDAATFAMAKDSIYKHYGNKDSLTLNLFDEDFNKVLDKYFHTNAFSVNQTNEIDKLLEKEFPDFMKFSGMALNYKISLPGKIIETNAPFLNGDTLTWKVNDERFYFNAYELNAVSRKPNYWAFGVTGIIVALSILGFWVKRK
jgi:hypothetical protein